MSEFEYRKKPVVIQAVRNTGDLLNERLNTKPRWLFDAIDGGAIHTPVGAAPKGSLSIDTAEGTMRADPGDWIIRGTKGEIYPCKPDIFEEIYEKLGDVDDEEVVDGVEG